MHSVCNLPIHPTTDTGHNLWDRSLDASLTKRKSLNTCKSNPNRAPSSSSCLDNLLARQLCVPRYSSQHATFFISFCSPTQLSFHATIFFIISYFVPFLKLAYNMQLFLFIISLFVSILAICIFYLICFSI